MPATFIVTEKTDDGGCLTQKKIISDSDYISYLVSLLFNQSILAFVVFRKFET